MIIKTRIEYANALRAMNTATGAYADQLEEAIEVWEIKHEGRVSPELLEQRKWNARHTTLSGQSQSRGGYRKRLAKEFVSKLYARTVKLIADRGGYFPWDAINESLGSPSLSGVGLRCMLHKYAISNNMKKITNKPYNGVKQ